MVKLSLFPDKKLEKFEKMEITTGEILKHILEIERENHTIVEASREETNKKLEILTEQIADLIDEKRKTNTILMKAMKTLIDSFISTAKEIKEDIAKVSDKINNLESILANMDILKETKNDINEIKSILAFHQDELDLKLYNIMDTIKLFNSELKIGLDNLDRNIATELRDMK